jgi:hypothetical protein
MGGLNRDLVQRPGRCGPGGDRGTRRARSPPEEFAEDHARLIASIETTKAISEAIAAEAAAGELQSLRVGDARLETMLGKECGTIAELSQEFRQVALLVGPRGMRISNAPAPISTPDRSFGYPRPGRGAGCRVRPGPRRLGAGRPIRQRAR